MTKREHKIDAIALLFRLLRKHGEMLEDPASWSLDDGAKNSYYALRNKVEHLLAKGLEAEAETEELRRVLTSPEWVHREGGE
jgi:hypothetical protein